MCHNRAFHSQWGKFMHGPQSGRQSGGPRFRHRWAGGFVPPVNVREADDKYELLVFAPGFAKTDFTINVADDVLTVAGKKQQSDLGPQQDWRRQEFNPEEGFERSFVLNEKVDVSNIGATYDSGILTVTLPKLPGTETRRKDVFIA